MDPSCMLLGLIRAPSRSKRYLHRGLLPARVRHIEHGEEDIVAAALD